MKLTERLYKSVEDIWMGYLDPVSYTHLTLPTT